MWRHLPVRIGLVPVLGCGHGGTFRLPVDQTGRSPSPAPEVYDRADTLRRDERLDEPAVAHRILRRHQTQNRWTTALLGRSLQTRTPAGAWAPNMAEVHDGCGWSADQPRALDGPRGQGGRRRDEWHPVTAVRPALTRAVTLGPAARFTTNSARDRQWSTPGAPANPRSAATVTSRPHFFDPGEFDVSACDEAAD
jgi:hypothetical protein